MEYKTSEKRRRYMREWRERNREHYKEYHREWMRKWRKKNPECNREYQREWIKKNPESRSKHMREWTKRNPEYHREYVREKRKNNIGFHLHGNISAVIWFAIKHNKAGRKWETLVGYNLKDLMTHLEAQFDENMFWHNYGTYWWIDHIKPRSLFKYETAEDPEFRKCWALENLQPMEKIANMRKSNHYSKVN